MFKTIENNAKTIVIEKKSKFIANVFYVEDIFNAEKIIEEIKKHYHDARHNCFAYRILDGNSIIEKQSDDGEPSRNSRSTNVKYITETRTVKCINCSN